MATKKKQFVDPNSGDVFLEVADPRMPTSKNEFVDSSGATYKVVDDPRAPKKTSKVAQVAENLGKATKNQLGAAAAGLIGGIPGMVLDPLDTLQSKATGKKIYPEGTVKALRDMFGVEEPTNTTERVAQGVASTLGEVATGVGLGNLITKGATAAAGGVPSMRQAVGTFLAEQPAAQAAAATTTTGTIEGLQDQIGAGSSTALGLVAGLAAGALTGKAVNTSQLKRTQEAVESAGRSFEKNFNQQRTEMLDKAGLQDTGRVTKEGKPVLTPKKPEPVEVPK